MLYSLFVSNSEKKHGKVILHVGKLLISKIVFFHFSLSLILILLTIPQPSFASSWQSKLNKGKEEYAEFFHGNYNKGSNSASAEDKRSKSKPRDALCGFMSQDAKDYIDPGKTLDLRQFLSGDLEVFGVACDYSKSIREVFYIDMNVVWLGNEGHLEETMNYESGKEEKRVWDFKFQDYQNYTATGTNVVRTATGKQEGNTAILKYGFVTPYGFIKMHLSMDDRWFLIDNNTAVNRIFMKKFGIGVGEVMMVVKKKIITKKGGKNVKKRK